MGVRKGRLTFSDPGSPGFDPGFESNPGSDFRLKTQSVRPKSPGSLGLDPKTSRKRSQEAKGRDSKEMSVKNPGDPGSFVELPGKTMELVGGNPGSTLDRSRVGPWIFALPIRTRSTLNLREHWAARHRRHKQQRLVVRLTWPWKGRSWAFPVVVRFTRLSPGTRPMDDDNLAGALKAVRDEVAAQLGLDDGDRARVRWEYAQERGPWGVRIEVRPG